MHQLRSMQALKAKHDSDAPLEVHRLRVALRREQAVRDEVQQQLDALKRSSDMSRYAAGPGHSAGGDALELALADKDQTDRLCARLRLENQALREELRVVQEELGEVEEAGEAMAQEHERETALLRQRLRLCEDDAAVADEEVRRLQARYSVLVAQLQERGISRYLVEEGQVGLEALAADAHQGVDVDMLWQELHLVGHERDRAISGLLHIMAELPREFQVARRPLCATSPAALR